MLFHAKSILAGACTILALGASAVAATVPFTEDFVADAAGWRDASLVSELDWFASGGPDAGSFASGQFNFVALEPNSTPAVIRAQDEFNASGGAFLGDWLSDGVTEVSFQIRHNGSGPMTFFTRFSGPANFPGAVALEFAPVPANQWTQITVAIDPNNPAIILEGFPFDAVFGNIGHVQIGVAAGAMAGVDQDVRFDIDKVSFIPEPASLVLLTLGAFVIRRVRR